MNPSLSVIPSGAAPQPAGKRAANSADEQAAAEVSDLAIVPLPDLLQRLHSTEVGLRASGAAAILEAVGPNLIAAAPRKGLLFAFIGRLGNPLVLILLFAAAVSAFTGDVVSFVIIAVIVFMS